MAATMLCDYVAALYEADSVVQAFDALCEEAVALGFDAVLYTYIPKPIVAGNFSLQPVYLVSDNFCPDFLDHYSGARLDRFDPLIRAVTDGIQSPIDWWGDVCEHYKLCEKQSREVIDLSRSCGIHNGITLPLLSGERGIAGASFINQSADDFALIKEEGLEALTIRTQLFHSLVMSDSGYLSTFMQPLFNAFSKTQLELVRGMVSGQSAQQIASSIGTSTGYLEQAMLKLRRKLSGAADGESDSDTINRNQLMYYAGLLNMLESDLTDVKESLKSKMRTE